MSDGVCTQDNLNQDIVRCLTPNQRIGLASVVEAGLISVIALVGVYVWIFVSHTPAVMIVNQIANQVRAFRHPDGVFKLVQRPMDLFLVSLQIIRENFMKY